MALMLEEPVITSNLAPGYGVYGTADPWVANASTPFPNGAYNPPGAVAFLPAPSMNTTTLATSNGYAAGLWVKYVLYKSSQTVQNGPAVVYYADETFTYVTPTYSSSITANAAGTAGVLLPNAGSVAGVGIGSAVSGTILTNSGNGCYVWIGVCGFVPQCYLSAGGGIGNGMMGASGSFTTATVTTVLRPFGYCWSAATSTYYFDVLMTLWPF